MTPQRMVIVTLVLFLSVSFLKPIKYRGLYFYAAPLLPRGPMDANVCRRYATPIQN